MKDVPIIRIVRDDGLGDENPSFLIDGSPWHILEGGLEGFDGIDTEVSTADYAQYDGSYLLGERSAERDRTIEVYGMPAPGRDRDDLRREAERFFVAGRGFEVHVEWRGRRRFFRARQARLAVAVEPHARGQRVTWTCVALDPYLLGEDEHSFNVAAAEARFGFPWVSYMDRWSPTPEATNEAAAEAVYGAGGIEQPAHVAGFVVGVVARTIDVVNDGSATAYPRFDVTATGNVTNPSVEVRDRSGAVACAFGVSLSMAAGDRLTVDFGARPTAIELNGSSVANRVTPGSTLTAGLAPGTYSVSWSSASGDASMGLVPTIRERYVSL